MTDKEFVREFLKFVFFNKTGAAFVALLALDVFIAVEFVRTYGIGY